MSRLDWTAVGERFYETGVDRGVLYVEDLDGVAWPGLISVSESPSGGESTSYYLDGVKYLNRAAREEYEATIEAYFSPPEFDACDGNAYVYDGLYATQQKRKPFGLSYRTRVGNDVDGTDHGYKIHIVYNALATPTDHDNETISDSPTAAALSWKITTKPEAVTDFTPTAHLVVDSRVADAELISRLEDILYGSDTTTAALITPADLVALFEEYATFKVVITGPDTYSASGTGVSVVSSDLYALDNARVIDNADGTFSIMEES